MQRAASDELRALKREKLRRLEARAETLLAFVPRVSPNLVAPSHLAPVADLFEHIARGERVRASVAIPAQHGKTETLLHAVAWLLRRDPRASIAYATYAQAQADSKSLHARRIATACGVIDATSDARATLREWRTPQGGGALFTGVEGPLTGQTANVLVVDDPHKSREDADSRLARDKVADWLTSVGITRLPANGSVVLVHTRWNEDDMIGRARRGDFGAGWTHVNLPFLSRADGTADTDGDRVLWPRLKRPDGSVVGWTVEDARRRLAEVGPYDAASIYQGEPRPRGGIVFAQPTRVAAPVITGRRIVIGCDCAGTDGPQSDHTVLVALAVGDDPDETGRRTVRVTDVVGVLRLRLRPEHAAPQVLAWQRQFGGVPLTIEATRDGKDLGAALQRISRGIVVRYATATGDKFVRSQPVAAAWNAGRVRVPLDARTMRATTDADLADFVRVVTSFAGMGDREDDDVDALSHAWGVAITGAGTLDAPVAVVRTLASTARAWG